MTDLRKSQIKGMVKSTIKLKKFTFENQDMAFNVRKLLYELLIKFDENKNYELQEDEIKEALIQLLGENPQQVSYVTRNVFRYDQNSDGIITFEEFTNFCLENHFGEMAIQRLHRNGMYKNGYSRKMEKQQFIMTLKYCLSFIKYQVNPTVLQKIFKEIDQDDDGFISYSDYFLFLKEYFGSQSQSAVEINVQEVERKIQEEQQLLRIMHSSQNLQESRQNTVSENSPLRKSRNFGEETMKKSHHLQKISFSNLSIAFDIRKLFYELLLKYDENHNYELEQEQIKNFLIHILGEDENELSYVIKNVFRYDLDNDSIITFEEFTNFCLEIHFGEMAIQRLHKKKTYSYGYERKMTKQQFIKTIKYCFSFLNYSVNESLLQVIFDQVNINNDGFLTYSEYFQFLKDYFGSESVSAKEIKVEELSKNIKKNLFETSQNLFKSIHLENEKISETSINLPIRANNSSSTFIKTTGALTTTSRHQFLNESQIQKLNSHSKRLLNLIKPQLKIQLMSTDKKRNVSITREQASAFIKRKFTFLNENFINELYQSQRFLDYQSLAYHLIFNELIENAKNSCTSTLTKKDFVASLQKGLGFVQVKPFDYFLREIFDSYTGSAAEISKDDYESLVRFIVTNK